jgi:hypothetical protein
MNTLAIVLWVAVASAILAGAGIVIAFTMLLGTTSYRKRALPLLWISLGILAATIAGIVIILLSTTPSIN